MKVDIVKLKFFCKLTNNYVFIEAVSIPNICPPLKNQEIFHVQKNYKNLRRLLLADKSSGCDLSVQLLIGLQVFL